jgi:hypothetical protein
MSIKRAHCNDEYLATIMRQKDNWGEFEVEWRDPDRSLERAEQRVTQLEKDQEDVLENGKKIKELVDKCQVNDKLQLDAMENQQRSMKHLSIGLGVTAAVLGLLQFSNLLFIPIKRWYLKRLGAEEDTLIGEQRNRQLTRRVRRMKRSHARQWQIEG